MRNCIVLAGLFSILLSGSADAQEITAVCQEPVGRIYGQHGAMGKNKTIDVPDKMTGGVVSINWNGSDKTAQIITQGAKGTPPLTEEGVLVSESNEQVSFVIVYPQAVWLYSLFLEPKILLMTQHSNGLATDSGGAINKSFKCDCQISIT